MGQPDWTDCPHRARTELHSRQVRSVSSPVDTVGVIVPSTLLDRVEVVNPDVTSSDQPVVGDHGSSDTTEQNTVGTKVVGESGGGSVQEPRVHGDTDNGCNVTTSSDVDVS